MPAWGPKSLRLLRHSQAQGNVDLAGEKSPSWAASNDMENDFAAKDEKVSCKEVHEHTVAMPVNRDHQLNWVAPITMATLLSLGITFALAHHFHYSRLDGRIVGSISRQQWALAIGNGLAIAVSFSLKGAITVAYTQFLWKELSRKSLSLYAINGAFTVRNNVFGLLNWEFISKFPIGSLLALLLWIMPLGSLFTPATLSVGQANFSTSEIMPVYNTGFNNLSLMSGYYVEGSEQRTAPGLQRQIDGAAVTGRQLPPQSLAAEANMSYSLQSYIPLLRCQDNDTLVNHVSDMVTNATDVGPGFSFLGDTNFTFTFDPSTLTYNNTNENLTYQVQFSYFAAVPFDDTTYFTPNGSRFTEFLKPWWNTSQPLTPNGDDTSTTNLIGQLWLAANNGSALQFMSCDLYNASVTYDVVYTNHVGYVTNVNTTYLNTIDGDQVVFTMPYTYSYWAYFLEVCSYLIGGIGTANVGAPNSSDFSNGLGNFQATPNLLGTDLVLTSQINDIMQTATNGTTSAILYNTTVPERTASVPEMIEQFALNASMSVLNNPVLCETEMANVTISNTQNVYTYQATNLIISYSIALGVSVAAVLLGGHSFWRNGASYDATISTFATTMQNSEVRDRLMMYPGGAQPLDRGLGDLKLRFQPREGFVMSEYGK